MQNEKKNIFENYLKTAFESGYSNAASSFSKMSKEKIYFNNFQFGFHKLDSKFSSERPLLGRTGENILITTDIFGDVTGKSYFFLNDKEFELLTNTIPQGRDPKINLKEEFAKEVDNILSASVITELANELKVKMYGDVPILVGKVCGNIEDIIFDDFRETTQEIYINSIFFSFENQPVIKPFFIWVVSSNVQRILEEKIAVLNP